MDEWQKPSISNNHIRKVKRAFVGNLTPNADLESNLKDLFTRSNISIHKLQIIKPKVGTNCFALVECEVEEAIKCLNGVEFQGSRIVVQKEKKQTNKSNGNGKSKNSFKFGGGWAKPNERSKPKSSVTSKSTINQSINDGSCQHENKLTVVTDKQNDSCSSVSNNDGSKKPEKSKNAKDEIRSFHERCKLNIDKLMEEYGEYDPDFEKMKVDATNEEQSSGMLAPNGSAPIDLELVSFGFKYSVPPQARQGWSHSNPLSPIDCRSLPRCPHYVAKLSGLSFKVKKAFLSKDYYQANHNGDDDEEGMSISQKNHHSTNDYEDESSTSQNPLITKRNEISQSILKALEEAIKDGNHGYAFPLQATIFVGSEYGRHRSVVLCENIAMNLRSLLRANDLGRISVPISVCVRHRDVDKQHRDGEAFGDDLRRIHEAEVKRKKKQEWLENRNDNSYW